MATSSRDRILNAAQQRLLALGPAGLVLDAIARDAGVSKGGLLYHFSTKDELIGGLCARMLSHFDERLASEYEDDPEPTGAWTRSYLASTVTEEGKPADDSAQLMAGLLATLGRDSEHLEAVRQRFGLWQERFAADGIDPTRATLVRLAADGLWLSALLGLPQLDDRESREVISALRRMTHA